MRVTVSPASVEEVTCYMCLKASDWRTRAARVLARLTNLQLGVGLAQAPADAAVTVRLLKQVVQNLSDRLSLVHHQRLGAAVAHQHLYY